MSKRVPYFCAGSCRNERNEGNINNGSICDLFIYIPSQESDDQSQNQHEYAGISNIYASIHTYIHTYVRTYVVLTLTHEDACIQTKEITKGITQGL